MLLLFASQINLLGFGMIAPILVVFIVFMLASAFSIDVMLRRDQTEEIDVSSPSSKRSKSPNAKKPSSKKTKPPHAKKPSKQSSETLRSVIESTAPELELQLSNKASCSESYPYWCTGCEKADVCCDEPCSSLSCDDGEEHCVDKTVTDTNSSPSPARTRKPRSTPRSKRPSKPSSETLRTVLESTAPELELQVGNKVGCSGSYPYRCTGCGKDDACCDEPCSSLTCDDVEDHCVDKTVTDTNSYPSPAKTKEPSKPY